MSAFIGFQHKSPKSGCKLQTLFNRDCDNGVSAGIVGKFTSPKFGRKLPTLIDSVCDNGVSAGI